MADPLRNALEHPEATVWKDGEVDYCRRLIRAAGDHKVRAAHVSSYIQLQMDDAVRDECIHAARALLALRVIWESR